MCNFLYIKVYRAGLFRMARRGFKDAHTENRNYWSEVFFEQHLKQVAVRGKAQQTFFVSFNRQFKILQPGRR